MVIILLTLIFIRPFISSLAFPEANTLYCYLLLAAMAIWITLKKLPVPACRMMRLMLGLFCLALVISLFFTDHAASAAGELYKYASGILLFLIASSFDEKSRSAAIKAIALSGFAIGMLAIYQYYFGFYNLLHYLSRQKDAEPFVLEFVSRRRVFFPFVTPNTLAGFLIMVMPLALTVRNRIWYLLPMATALILTKSLGGLFSLLLAITLYYYLRGKIDRKRILFFAAIVTVTAVVVFIRSNTPGQHTHPSFSSLMRWNYWRQTLSVIATSPLIGVGLGNFNLSLSRYAHNSYLQIWAETGILGLAGFLGIVYLSFAEAAKKLHPATGRRRHITMALMASSAAFLIHNLVDFSFFLPEVSLVWWMVLGLMLAPEAHKGQPYH